MRLDAIQRPTTEARQRHTRTQAEGAHCAVFPRSIRKIVRTGVARSVGCRLRDLVATEMQRDADADLVEPVLPHASKLTGRYHCEQSAVAATASDRWALGDPRQPADVRLRLLLVRCDSR